MRLGSWLFRRGHSNRRISPFRKSKSRLTLEPLEGREVPAVFGFAWPSPAHLTISFVPDGTQIAGNASDLSSKLNAEMPSATWQAQILKAFQTWAVHANIDIGVVPDDGSPFGTNGLMQGDPRFGDIRIGGLAMAPSTLAVSTPPEPFTECPSTRNRNSRIAEFRTRISI